VIGALIFGPKNLAGLGKDLGKVAGSLKAEVRFALASLDMLRGWGSRVRLCQRWLGTHREAILPILGRCLSFEGKLGARWLEACKFFQAATFSEAMNESLNDAQTEFAEEKKAMAAEEKPKAAPAAEAKPAAKKVDLTDE